MLIMEDWVSKLWSIQIMEYCAVVKKNEEKRMRKTVLIWSDVRYLLNEKKRCKIVCAMLHLNREENRYISIYVACMYVHITSLERFTRNLKLP